MRKIKNLLLMVWMLLCNMAVNAEVIDIANNANSMLYSNAPCTNTQWGDQFVGWHVLFDGDSSTYFHSEYSDIESADGLDHYLRVDLGEGNEIGYFTFTYTVRGDETPYYTPTEIVVEGSNEPYGTYTEIAVLTGLPTGKGAVYESSILGKGVNYRYIRYRVTKTNYNYKVKNHPYFYFAEFGMTKEVVVASGICGNNLTWAINGEGRLVIEGTGAMYDYSTRNDVPWISYKSSLKEIQIKKGVTSVGAFAFSDCVLLTSVIIPEGITSIGVDAFSHCKILETVLLSQSVEEIGRFAFYGCNKLTSINIPEGVTRLQAYSFQFCTKLESLVIPESVISIESAALSHCDELKYLVIPSGLRTISDNAFDFSGLESIIIGENVSSIGASAFDGCSNLEYIICKCPVPPTIVNNTFSGISSKILVSPSTLSAYQSATNWHAQDCFIGGVVCNDFIWYLNDGELFILGSGNMADYTEESPSPWFEIKDEFIRMTIQEGITSIGAFAFYKCRKMVSVNLPESVKSIGRRAFAGCNKLATINIPEGVTEIAYNTFGGCSLTNIIIPESVKSIGEQAFYNCNSLTSIVIPAGVTSIGAMAFKKCGLNTVTCLSVNPLDVPEDVFEETPQYRLYVPRESYDAYCAAEAWSGFSKIIRLGDEYEITYEIDGDIFLTDYITSGEKFFTLDAGQREGHTFSGWQCAERLYDMVEIDIAGNADAMLYSNALCKTNAYGDQFVSWAALFDGNFGTVFHSDYSGENSDDGLEHYLRVDLGEENEFSMFSFTYGLRSHNAGLEPTRIVVEGSNEAFGEYTEIAVLTDLPTVIGGIYESDILSNGNSYRYIRFRVLETAWNSTAGGGHSYFCISEFGMYGYAQANNSMITEMVMPAKDIVLEGTYNKNSYSLIYVINSDTISAESVVYGTKLTVLEVPTKEGYTFSGWSEIPDSMPAGNVTIIGSFTINSYTLTYTVDGDTVQTDSVVYNTEIVALEEPTKEGYTFSGWSEIPDSMPANDVTITGIFTINKYLVTFKIGDMVIAADSLEYKAAIIAPEAPEKEGYTFNGWGEVAETVPAHDVTYEGTYTVNVYKVYYYVGEDLVHTAEVAYGESIPEYVYEPTIEGDIFEGWVGENHEIMPAHDVVYTANITNRIDRLNLNSQHSTIYNLTGHKVLVDDMSKLSKGIYIINGRKVLVR